MGDLIIYLMMQILLQLLASNVSDDIKKCYKDIVVIMLKKKRLNTDITELEKIVNGDLPIPNSGKVTDFYKFMNIISTNLGLRYRPLTMWYVLCLAVGNNDIINGQLDHCLESIIQDNLDAKTILDTTMKHLQDTKLVYCEVTLPSELSLEYICPITLDDTSNTGGYKFKEHKTIIGELCCPMYVMSDGGFNDLKKDIACVNCFTKLTIDDFDKVGPKPDIKLNELVVWSKDTKNIYSTKFNEPIPMFANDNKNISVPRNKKLENKGIVIIMEGTVGAGKSTMSELIKKQIEDRGGLCIIEGTDKYCKTGVAIRNAIDMITSELLKLESSTNPLTVAIIDTCGDKKGKYIFNVDFSNWKTLCIKPNFDKARIRE
jgi:hypothetical protein